MSEEQDGGGGGGGGAVMMQKTASKDKGWSFCAQLPTPRQQTLKLSPNISSVLKTSNFHGKYQTPNE